MNLHLSKGTHWVCYMNETYFDSYGVVCPKELSRYIIKLNGHCLYSEYKIQGPTKKRFFLCKLLFIYNLLDKSLRNRF